MHLGKIAAASQVISLTVVVITRVVHSLVVVALHAITPLPSTSNQTEARTGSCELCFKNVQQTAKVQRLLTKLPVPLL